jgi:hypothetical protein
VPVPESVSSRTELLKQPILEIVVHRLTCGACGFVVSALTEERRSAWMLDHLRFVHMGDRVQ